MPPKTISLEVDAYNRLKATRRAGESFSEVVRRITLPPAKATAADLLAEVKAGTSVPRIALRLMLFDSAFLIHASG